MPELRRGLARALFALTLAISFAACAAEKKAAPPALPAIQPTASIAVTPLGYQPPSDAYLTARPSFVSLDFVDENHLLFTFHKAGLLKRMPDCPPDDQDQGIIAQVIEIPGGKVVRNTEWRMHDRGRYLWPIRNGHFLVRQHDSLYETDDSLELKPFLEFSQRLLSVRISPDKRLLIAQVRAERHTPEEHERLETQADAIGAPRPKEDVELLVIDIATRGVIGKSHISHTTDLPVVSDGYIEVLPGKKNQWMIRYSPFHGDGRELSMVPSTCDPSVTLLSSDVALFFTCDEENQSHPVYAYSLEGKKVWNQVWETRYIWPTFSTAENGTRFAFSSLALSHPVSTFDPIGDADVTAQVVGVFDTSSGQLRLVRNATPVTSAGQNYAMSPSGNRFAVLRNGELEVYDLPPAAAVAESAPAASAKH
jgi:hypothetical protein